MRNATYLGAVNKLNAARGRPSPNWKTDPEIRRNFHRRKCVRLQQTAVEFPKREIANQSEAKPVSYPINQGQGQTPAKNQNLQVSRKWTQTKSEKKPRHCSVISVDMYIGWCEIQLIIDDLQYLVQALLFNAGCHRLVSTPLFIVQFVTNVCYH